MLTRRQFLKAAAGAALGLVVYRAAGPLAGVDRPMAGPKVLEGLTYAREGDLVRAYWGDQAVLEMNGRGGELIRRADGSQTLQALIQSAGAEDDPEAVADFFLALGRAGWLENRFEVQKYVIEG